ncbi:hypothetical protein AGMMS49525_17640 [Bacteroidia bacterium]|nr:hypothetical protein AGMMS49525_17640 [Bacteroidia bacterium]
MYGNIKEWVSGTKVETNYRLTTGQYQRYWNNSNWGDRANDLTYYCNKGGVASTPSLTAKYCSLLYGNGGTNDATSAEAAKNLWNTQMNTLNCVQLTGNPTIQAGILVKWNHSNENVVYYTGSIQNLCNLTDVVADYMGWDVMTQFVTFLEYKLDLPL